MTTDWWTVAGTGALGLTIGWLVWTFVVRSTTLPIKAISTLVAIVAGSASLLVWKFAAADPLPKEANSYFIGIFVSAFILGLLNYKPPTNSN